MTASAEDPLAGAAWGADEVCALVEEAVQRWLPALLPPDLERPVVWEQLPNPESLSSADVPAIAISTPGLAADPVVSDRGDVVDLTFAVMVSVWVRGADATPSSTTSALRRYLRALTGAVLAGGRDNGNEWRLSNLGFDQTPGESARTLQFGFVQIDVPVYGAVELDNFPTLDGSTAAAPLLERIRVSVTHERNPEES